MAKAKKQSEPLEEIETLEKPKPQKELSEDAKAKICEEYLGVHPKYFLYSGQSIRVNIWPMERDGTFWRGWRIDEKEKGTWLGS